MCEDTIIFLFVSPALQTDISKYRLEELRKLVNKIIVCDLSQALAPEINKCVTAARMNTNSFAVQTMRTKSEIKKFIQIHNEKCFYFPIFSDYYDVRYVYYLFVIYKIRYGYVNDLNPDIFARDIPKMSFAVEKLHWNHVKKVIYNRFIRRINKFNPAKFLFYASGVGREYYFWKGNCKKGVTKEIGVHSFDYDRFMDSDKFEYGKKYVAYLDDFLPYHPDLIDLPVHIDSQKYHEEMNEMFDTIEKKTGYEVLVAAHTRANYADKEYSFDKEKIYYGKTTELVKGAEFLIGKWSNTNMMAVMSDKPLVIICPDEVEKQEYFKNVPLKQAEFFHSKLIRNKEDVAKLNLEIDEDRYAEIRSQYLGVDGAKKPDLWVRIIAEISKLKSV